MSLNKKQTQFICTCMKRYSILVNDHQALTEGTGPMLFFSNIYTRLIYVGRFDVSTSIANEKSWVLLRNN